MRHVIAFGIMLAVLFTVQPIWSQEARGRILGRVTDSSGAVVPGATVRLRHVETNITRTTETNAQGNFSVPLLTTGAYEISAEKQGFKRYVRGGIELRINDDLEVNVSLEVGAQTESVTVMAETPLLETASAAIGQVVDARRAAELPLMLGNSMDLVRMAPAVAMTGNMTLNQPWEPNNGTSFTMAGSNSMSANVTMDGAANSAQDGAQWPPKNVAAFNPPPDAVGEMKIQTATFDGTVGMTEGGVINISIKSGTNALHGTAYGGFTPTALTANLWFSNKNNIPRPDAHVRRWGGVVNGPVWIPKIYNGKNKTFFMYSYEGTHYASIRGSNNTVPTAAQRAGDLSDLLAIGPQYQVYNPFSRRAVGGGRYQVDPIVGNIITSVRPISPIATALMNPKNYLLPTTAGDTVDGTNNYPRPDATQQVKYMTTLGRIDHNFSENHRFFIRAHKSMTTIADPILWGPESIYSTTFFWNMGRGFAFDDVYLLNPTTVLNVKLSDSAWVRASDSNPLGIIDLTQAYGFPASYNNLFSPTARRTPNISISDYTGFSGASQGKNWRPQETRALAVNLDKMKGVHGLKFGFEYMQLRMNNYSYSANAQGGSFSFDQTYTRGPFDNSTASPRGQGLAAFLLDVPSSGTVNVADSFSEMSTLWSGYIQDDWKVTRKLSLNLSLRYELEGPITERYNRTVRDLDPNAAHSNNFDTLAAAAYAANPIAEVPVSTWSTKGGIRYAGVNGVPREVINRDTNNLMPRVGFAYSLDARTVIRGGFGYYYSTLGQRRMDVIQTGFSQDTNFVPTLDSGLTFIASMANPYPSGILQPLRSSKGADMYLGQGISYFSPDIKAARTRKFQLSIQRQLPSAIVFEGTYIYSRGDQWQTNRDPRYFPSQYLSQSPIRDQANINYWSANVPNPFAGLVPGTSMNGNTIIRSSLVRNFPQFSGMGDQTNEGGNWYHGVTAKFERRFAQGFTVTWNYTFSKNIAETGFLNADDLKPEHVLNAIDYPHRIQASFIYELPFGRGRKILPKTNSVASGIISGWQISGLWMMQTGAPLGWGDSIYYGADLRDTILPSDVQNTNRWFDTSMFEKSSSKQLSNHYRTMSSRFGFFRPGRMNQWDMSLLKNTRISEKINGQFRFEAMNAFNSTWFANPNTSPSSTSFGQVASASNQPRKIQMQFKMVF